MSLEMDCVKHSVLGGQPEDLPTDLVFILERNYSNVLDFLNGVWKNPHPCYFVWVTKSQFTKVTEANNMSFPYEVLGTDQIEGEPAALLKVSSSMFDHFDVSERISLNGETGWLIKKVYKKPKKAINNEFGNLR